MKNLKSIVIGCLMLLAFQSNSQVQVNVNIGTAPQWGPSGYSEVRYYYLPDIETYYDIESTMFIYLYNGNWVRRSYLPSYCRNYDLYSGYKVVLNDYHGYKPYNNFHNHKTKYGKGYKGKPQKNIGMKPGKGNNHHNDKGSSKSPIKFDQNQKNSPINMKGNENHGGKKGGNNGGNSGGGKGGNHGGGKGKK